MIKLCLCLGYLIQQARFYSLLLTGMSDMAQWPWLMPTDKTLATVHVNSSLISHPMHGTIVRYIYNGKEIDINACVYRRSTISYYV